MKIEVRCGTCKRLLSISTKYCGKKVKCLVCGRPVAVPAATEQIAGHQDEWSSVDGTGQKAETGSEDARGYDLVESSHPKSSEEKTTHTRSPNPNRIAASSDSGVKVNFVSPPTTDMESLMVINAGKKLSKGIEAFLKTCGKIDSAVLTVEALQSYASVTEHDISSELSIRVYGHVNANRVDEFFTGDAALDQRYGFSSAGAQALQARQSVQAGMDRIAHEFLETFIERLVPVVPGITKGRGGLLTWTFLASCLVFAGLLLFLFLFGKHHLRPQIDPPVAVILSLIMAAAVSCSLLFAFVGFASDQSVMSFRLGREYLSACRASTARDTIFIGFGIAIVCWLIPLFLFHFLFDIGG